ncbi:MAG: Do family serine endopeptidase [Caulobacterales bacterium]
MRLTKRLLLSAALFAAACSPPATPTGAAEPPASGAPGAPQAADRRLPVSQTEMRMSLAPVAAKASPAVVSIRAQRVTRTIVADPMFGRFGQFFGVPRDQVQQSLGSGVIVRGDGIIVTNNHVIDGATELRVILADRREFDAKLIVADPRTDLAVLRINPGSERLPALGYADTRRAQVGDLVLAIGNPFGLQQTVTSGIISALARTDVGITDFSFFIQTDAAINKGNSGGALVDMNGDLVGVNTAIFSESGGSVGVGFAVPAEMVRRVVDGAVTEGKVVRGWIGVRGQSVTQDLARSLGFDRPQGVLVTEMFNDGPAERSGLRVGDVVLSVNGQPVADEQGLRFQTDTQKPGATVALAIRRGAEARTIQARIDPLPRANPEPRELSGPHPLDGTRVVTLSPAVADERGLDPFVSGALIEAMDGRGLAARLGLRPGDIVREINGRGVRSAPDVERAVKAPQGRTWTLVVERNGERVPLQVTI